MRHLAIVLAILPSLAAAQEITLGRLFFTPQERATLDRERLKAGMPTLQAAEDALPAESITLTGHIQRSSGKSTVWLNGKPQHESDSAKPVTAKGKRNAPGEIIVRLPDKNQSYPLKVGQTLIPASGEIREGYQAAAPVPDAAKPAGAAPQTSRMPAMPPSGAKK